MKRIVALALLVAMLLALAACAKPTTPPISAPPTSETPKESAPASGVPAESPPAQPPELGFPIVKDKITLTAFGNQNVTHKDWKDLYCFNTYEELSNIHIDWTTAPNQGYNEKKNVLLASGEYPDIFYRAGLSVADIVNYGSQGALIPLNDLIDQYAPNLKARMEEIPSIKKEITMPDGNIYSLPTIEPSPTRGERNWMNAQWLKNVGMEAPTTIAELEAVLKAFKEQDANGNGDPNDEIPYSDRQSGISLFEATYSAFSIGNLGIGGFRRYVDRGADGKIRVFATTDDFKDQLAWVKSLYDQGLLDIEMFTQDIPTFTAKGEQGQIGAFFHNGNPEIIGAKHMADFINIGPMANVKTGERIYNNTRSMCSVGSFAISHTNKNPIESIRWVDYFYGEEGDRLIRLGQEGVTYEKTPEGQYRLTDLIRKNPDGLNMPQAIGQYAIGFAGGGCPEFAFTEHERARLPESAFIAIEQDEPFFKDVDLVNFSFTAEEQSRLNALTADIKTYIDESRVSFVTGKTSLDSWGDYVKTLENMGIEEYTQIYQQAYDRWTSVQ